MISRSKGHEAGLSSEASRAFHFVRARSCRESAEWGRAMFLCGSVWSNQSGIIDEFEIFRIEVVDVVVVQDIIGICGDKLFGERRIPHMQVTQLFQLQQRCPDVLDFSVILKVGAIAGKYYGIPVPLRLNLIFLSAGNLRGHKIRIREHDAHGIELKVLDAAEFSLLADVPAKPVKL